MRTLLAMLDALGEAAGAPGEIERAIWTRYGVEQAVLVLDACGFCRITRQHGIVHYLTALRRLQRAAETAVAEAGGVVVKHDGDNVYATFPTVPAAVQAAARLHALLAALNQAADESRRIMGSIGIGWGVFLAIPGEDVFGECVNSASRLGEDIAKGGEVLLTEEAWQRLGDARVGAEPLPGSGTGGRAGVSGAMTDGAQPRFIGG